MYLTQMTKIIDIEHYDFRHKKIRNSTLMNKFIEWLAKIFYTTPSSKQTQKIWDNREDDYILYAYHNAIEWMSLTEITNYSDIDIVINIANRHQSRLTNIIIPQMIKRKLKPWPAILVDQLMDEFAEKYSGE